MKTDSELLEDYAERGAETAFADLVARHLSLVYSAALRLVNGDAHLAQDITQTVFTDLARKAQQIAERAAQRREALPGWLFTSTRFAAATAIRANQRRRKYEEQAFSMSQQISNSSDSEDTPWTELRPLLDDAIARLDVKDRDAVILRFFQGQELSSVGSVLGLSEDAARMRVNRALDRLRKIFSRRGVNLPAATLGALIVTHSTSALPLELTAAAIAKVSTAIATHVVAAVKVVTITKFNLAVLAALIIAGSVTPWIFEKQSASHLREQNLKLISRIDSLQAEQQSKQELVQQLQQAKAENMDQLHELMRQRAAAAAMYNSRLADYTTFTGEDHLNSGEAKLVQLDEAKRAMFKFMELNPAGKFADDSGNLSQTLTDLAPQVAWNQIAISYSTSATTRKAIESFPDIMLAQWKEAESTPHGWKHCYAYADRSSEAAYYEREDNVPVPILMKSWLEPEELRKLETEEALWARPRISIEEIIAESKANRDRDQTLRRQLELGDR